MESFTTELLSNASAQLFPDNTLSFYKLFTGGTESKVNESLQFQKFPTHQCTKMLRKEKLFFDEKISKMSEFDYVEPGLHPFITDIVEAMNTLIQERHNHRENCITVKVSRRTQKVEIYHANEGSGLAFFSTDLGHIFGCNIGIELGVMLREKGPHKPDFA